MITGVILAAGAAERFGAQKLLAQVDGRPMICRVADAVLSSRLDDIVVVTAARAGVTDLLRGEFPGETRMRMVVNEHPERGLVSSLKTGIAAVDAGAAAAMVIHGDMPRVSARVIDQLVLESSWHGGIVVPVCEGQWRHPRVIPRGLFGEFLALAEDARGQDVIDRYRADVTEVAFDDPTIFVDIDTPADLESAINDQPPRESSS